MNDEKILNAFLLSNIVEIITQEEFEYVKKAIKNILKRNKELKEIEQEHKKENGELRKRVEDLEKENTSIQQSHMNLYNEFKEYKRYYSIPVSKIKEKIEEVNEEYSKVNTPDNNEWYIDSEKYAYAEEKLQELLEGE